VSDEEVTDVAKAQSATPAIAIERSSSRKE
jgi:hypothetical protein